VANEGRPWICAAFGLIGYSGPSKPLDFRKFSGLPPIFVGSDDAP
jgi:hypothetical protein